jgi:hypothetical protein
MSIAVLSTLPIKYQRKIFLELHERLVQHLHKRAAQQEVDERVLHNEVMRNRESTPRSRDDPSSSNSPVTK